MLTKFHENLPVGSKLLGATHRQTSDRTSLVSFLNKSTVC
jgi:hypothetical protein